METHRAFNILALGLIALCVFVIISTNSQGATQTSTESQNLQMEVNGLYATQMEFAAHICKVEAEATRNPTEEMKMLVQASHGYYSAHLTLFKQRIKESSAQMDPSWETVPLELADAQMILWQKKIACQ